MPDKTTPHIRRAARAIFESVPSLPPVCAWDDLAPYAQENYDHHGRAALSTTLEPSEAEIEAGAQAISLSFREEGFSAEHDDPSVWEEFRKAARDCLIAAARVRVGQK